MSRFPSFVTVLLLIVILLTGCTPKTTTAVTQPSFNIEVVSENWFYIDLDNTIGSVADNVLMISAAIKEWEVNNPEREIVSMQIIVETYAYSTRVDGISIYSKLK